MHIDHNDHDDANSDANTLVNQSINSDQFESVINLNARQAKPNILIDAKDSIRNSREVQTDYVQEGKITIEKNTNKKQLI